MKKVGVRIVGEPFRVCVWDGQELTNTKCTYRTQCRMWAKFNNCSPKMAETGRPSHHGATKNPSPPRSVQSLIGSLPSLVFLTTLGGHFFLSLSSSSIYLMLFYFFGAVVPLFVRVHSTQSRRSNNNTIIMRIRRMEWMHTAVPPFWLMLSFFYFSIYLFFTPSPPLSIFQWMSDG